MTDINKTVLSQGSLIADLDKDKQKDTRPHNNTNKQKHKHNEYFKQEPQHNQQWVPNAVSHKQILKQHNMHKKQQKQSKQINKDVSFEQHTTSLKQSVLQSYVHEKYSPINNQSKIKVFFYQFLGMIVFLVLALSVKNVHFADIHVGVGVLFGVIICGHVSGANLNPGVTFSNCVRKQNKFQWILLPLYYLAQLLGALLGIVICELVNDFKAASLMPQQPSSVLSCFRVVGSQAFGSFILIFFIMMISNPNTTFIDNELSGLLFIVTFVHTARKYAPMSHECINSMIAISFALVDSVQKGNAQGLLYSLLWVAGDLSGTIIAILFYEKLFEPNVEYMRKLKRMYQEKSLQSLLEEDAQGSESGIVMRVQKHQQFEVDQ